MDDDGLVADELARRQKVQNRRKEGHANGPGDADLEDNQGDKWKTLHMNVAAERRWDNIPKGFVV